MIPTAAILAGGLATRMYPETKKIPKSLIEIGGQPFIFHQLALLRREQITHVVMCVGYLGGQIQEAVGDGSEFDMNVEFSFDGDTLLGTGGALRKALPLLGDVFSVFYGDAYLDTGYPLIFEAFASQDKMGLMTVFENKGKWDTSNVVFRNGKIVNYSKKNLTPEMCHIDYGISLFRKEVFSGFPEDEYLDLADIHIGLMRKNELMGYEVYDRFYEIGSQKGHNDFNRYVEETGTAFTNKCTE